MVLLWCCCGVVVVSCGVVWCLVVWCGVVCCGVFVVCLWCVCGVVVVLWCCCGVVVVLLWCCCGVVVVLLWCCCVLLCVVFEHHQMTGWCMNARTHHGRKLQTYAVRMLSRDERPVASNLQSKSVPATPIKIQTTWGSTCHNKPWETRRTYHLKLLRFFFVSRFKLTGHRQRGTQKENSSWPSTLKASQMTGSSLVNTGPTLKLSFVEFLLNSNR